MRFLSLLLGFMLMLKLRMALLVQCRLYLLKIKRKLGIESLERLGRIL